MRPTSEQEQIIRGPLRSLRVAAGAGTGKTTTVALRVAALVRSHGLEPESILGITFTNKAAAELADRVHEALGPDHGEDRSVSVFTYHGFAAEILREFGALVGVERSSKLVTATFGRQMLRDLLRSRPFENVDITSPVTVEYVLALSTQMANNLIADAPQIVLDDEVSVRRHGYLAVVAAYRAEKARLGIIDYGDLIARAHRIAAQHPAAVEVIRSRYRAVVLDEYQDTDPAQRELLRLLFAGVVPVLAVGDEDQTIYEWRGASLENFRSFPDHFADDNTPAETLGLTLNRRSSAQIVSVANRIREHIDVKERKQLRPLPEAPVGEVRVAQLATSVAEADWIAADISREHEQGTPLSGMAVLFRKNRSMLVVHQALSRHGIPFQVANLGGLPSVPEVADLRCWLSILDRPEDGPAAARILLGRRYRLGLADLARTAEWAKRQEDEDLPYGVIEAIDNLDLLNLSDEARMRLERFRGTYRQLLTASQGVSLVETSRLILEVTGAWSDIGAMDDAAAMSARLNLYRFLDLAETWSPLEGRPSLGAFLDYLEIMSDDPAEELDVARIAVAEAVTLITIHRAKGLEWDSVYLPALVERTFPTNARYDDPFCKAQSLPYELRLDHSNLPRLTAEMPDAERHRLLKASYDSQEWRLAYVGVTRAKRRLTATAAHWYGHPVTTQKPAQASAIWDAIAEHAEIAAIDELPPRPERLGDFGDTNGAPDPLFDGGWSEGMRLAMSQPDALRPLAESMGLAAAFDRTLSEFQQRLFELPEPPPSQTLDRIQTSVTGLVTYGTCPQRFYWSEVDRMPRRPSPAARRGVEVHRKIELHGLGVVPLTEPDQAYDVPDTPVGADPYGVFLKSRFAGTRPHLTEAPFELRITDRVWARGRIDAVYRDAGWEIVDFKSGRAPNDPTAVIQLQAYALAATSTDLLATPVSAPGDLRATFAYLGGDELEEVTYEADSAWLERAKRDLSQLADGIAGSAYAANPGERCHSCDFLAICQAGQEFLRG